MRGKAYRRDMQDKKDRRVRKIIAHRHSGPLVGYIPLERNDGACRPAGDYIRRPKNSNIQKYLKRQSKRKVRRSEPFQNGNSYRKCMEYKWQFW